MRYGILIALCELALTGLLIFAPLSTEGRILMLGFVLTVAAIAAATDRIEHTVERHR
jgi:hypothetical protein